MQRRADVKDTVMGKELGDLMKWFNNPSGGASIRVGRPAGSPWTALLVMIGAAGRPASPRSGILQGARPVQRRSALRCAARPPQAKKVEKLWKALGFDFDTVLKVRRDEKGNQIAGKLFSGHVFTDAVAAGVGVTRLTKAPGPEEAPAEMLPLPGGQPAAAAAPEEENVSLRAGTPRLACHCTRKQHTRPALACTRLQPPSHAAPAHPGSCPTHHRHRLHHGRRR
jgi:hypothetical protein